jgi:hypothetical protein
MNSNEIFQKISENIIAGLNGYKKKEVSERTLNENLLLNVSSMCKFLQGRGNVNQSTFDVVIPMSRFSQGIENKIKSIDQETCFKQTTNDQTMVEDSFFGGLKEAEDNFGFNPNESMFSQSLIQTDNNPMAFDDNMSYLGRSEISTIYNYKDNESVIDQSFNNFMFNKLKIKEGESKGE